MTCAPSAWKGELDIFDGWAIWRGRVGDGTVHRHVAAQAVFAPEGEAVVETVQGSRITDACVLVEPLALHRLVRACEVELVFVEPWVSCWHVPMLCERRRQILTAARIADGSRPARFWPALAQGVVDESRGAPSPWMLAAGSRIDEQLAEGRVPLSALAQALGLSNERARHLFAVEMGLPFKRYVLWRRLRLAAMHLRAGAGATASAHAAGFADAAHLARTLKAMFGITATQLRTGQDTRAARNGSRSWAP